MIRLRGSNVEDPPLAERENARIGMRSGVGSDFTLEVGGMKSN